ncbi:MAG: cyclic nucleotide-binding domain-containing protein [Chloroflexi bacterium]|nr:MAG: cyclic nucleotide-binding domain-containing protein [Chloroflexota bacterium]
MTPDQTDLDLIIIGGGPAGLTAGLYAARANMKTVLLDSKDVGGEILNTELIEDYPGFESVTGADLARKMADHALKFGLRIETYKPVKQIRSDGDRKIVELEDGTELSAYAVIVTVGGEPTKLGIVGEKEYHGRGVSYCAVCDGAFFKGADLAVIGGGDSAFQEGLFLTRFAKKLYVVHRRNEFRAQAILRDRLLKIDKVEPITPAEVKEIGGNGDVKWMEIERDGKRERVNVEGVFVFIGFKPVGRYLFKEHIDHDKNGYLITDQFMRTSIPGVYAAGDTRAQLAKQITTAVGDATTAVLHAERYIEELKDIERTFPAEPKEVAAETASKAELVTFAPGDIVLKEGDAADRFYMIIKGEADVTQSGPDGAPVVINRFGAGDYFGEIGLLNDAPRKATVRARTPLEVMALDRETFARLMKSSQATEDEVRRVAAERSRAPTPR